MEISDGQFFPTKPEALQLLQSFVNWATDTTDVADNADFIAKLTHYVGATDTVNSYARVVSRPRNSGNQGEVTLRGVLFNMTAGDTAKFTIQRNGTTTTNATSRVTGKFDTAIWGRFLGPA